MKRLTALPARSRLRACLRGLAAMLMAASGLAQAGSFALIGDMPYSPQEIETMRSILLDISADRSIAFVVHDGDIKSGSEPCDEKLFAERRADFDLSTHPFVLIPGDNDWTDCHRENNGGFDPEERLAKLRELFFAGEDSLGRNRMKLVRQGALQPRHAAYRENVRWEFENILVVGLNLPGSNNNWKSRGENREFNLRLRANTDWLEAAFARARDANLRGVMVIVQANPGFERDAGPRRTIRPGYRDGYAEFRAQLAREARAFARPVIIVHGDTHYHRIDHPLKDDAGVGVPNVIRVETFGSPGLGWVKVHVDTRLPEVFRFEARRFLPGPQ